NNATCASSVCAPSIRWPSSSPSRPPPTTSPASTAPADPDPHPDPHPTASPLPKTYPTPYPYHHPQPAPPSHTDSLALRQILAKCEGLLARVFHSLPLDEFFRSLLAADAPAANRSEIIHSEPPLT